MKLKDLFKKKNKLSAEEYYSAVEQLIAFARGGAGASESAPAAKAFMERYRTVYGAGDLLLSLSEERQERGDAEGAAAFLLVLEQEADFLENRTTLFLRLAEYYLEGGEEERGRMYLKKLCTETVTNYEESIKANGLCDLWARYKPMVEGEVPVSEGSSEEMPLEELFALEGDALVFALTERISERKLNALNRWERAVFYANEAMEEINSGGFEGYLYYNGLHFEKAARAFETVGAKEMQGLAEKVRAKFPGGELPKTVSALQDLMDKQELDFETENDAYYDSAEKELLSKLCEFIAENKQHFR